MPVCVYIYIFCCCCLVAKSCPTLATPWTVALQAPLCMIFPRQEYWSGLLFPSPRDLPNAAIEPASPALAGGCFTVELPGKPMCIYIQIPIYRYLPIYTYNVLGVCNIHMKTLNLYLYSVIYMTLYKHI